MEKGALISNCSLKELNTLAVRRQLPLASRARFGLRAVSLIE